MGSEKPAVSLKKIMHIVSKYKVKISLQPMENNF